MNRFVSLALVLFASVAVVNCYGSGGYGASAAPGAYGGAAVEQVNLASLGNVANLGSIERYLNGGLSSYGTAGGSYTQAKYVAAPSSRTYGPVSSSSHSAAPSAAGYGAAALGGYGAAPGGYGTAPAAYGAAPAAYGAAGYGGASAPGGYSGAAAPSFSVLPAYVTEINRGKHSYKTFQTPIRYSKVALPIVASDPVAKLFVPNNYGSYGGNHGGYGGAAPISIAAYGGAAPGAAY